MNASIRSAALSVGVATASFWPPTAKTASVITLRSINICATIRKGSSLFLSTFLSRLSMQCTQSAILLWQIRQSVCPSVCPSSAGSVSKRTDTSANFFTVWQGHNNSRFMAPTPLQNSPRGISHRGIKYTGVGEFCNNYRFLSRKRYVKQTGTLSPAIWSRSGDQFAAVLVSVSVLVSSSSVCLALVSI